jgi:hypothetical protein
MPQAEYCSYHRTITNPFDIGMDETLPGLPQARHPNVGEYTQGCLLQLLELCDPCAPVK